MASPQAPAKPILENFYSVSEAAIRLGLRDPSDDSKKGEKWLRDGVNLSGWPCHRLAGQLKFSDSDLAEIAAIHRNKVDGRAGPRRPRRNIRKPSAGSPAQRAA